MLSNKLLDDIGRQILRILQEDGRISFNELGRKVGLSSPGSCGARPPHGRGPA